MYLTGLSTSPAAISLLIHTAVSVLDSLHMVYVITHVKPISGFLSEGV